LPEIPNVESPLLPALPNIHDPPPEVQPHAFTCGEEIAVPMPFFERRDEGHEFIHVASMEPAVQQGPRESDFIQSADRLPVEFAFPLQPALSVNPIGKRLV
jgi:hypothetical protein